MKRIFAALILSLFIIGNVGADTFPGKQPRSIDGASGGAIKGDVIVSEDSLNISPVATIDIPWANSLVVSDNYVYITQNNTSGMVIVDVSVKDSPKIVGQFNDPVNMKDPHSIAKQNNYVYVADWDDKLTIIDVSDKTSPKLASTITASTASCLDYPYGVDVQGRYAYVVAQEPGTASVGNFCIIDISDPFNPTYVGGLENDTDIDNVISVNCRGQYCYVGARGADQFAIIDISDPANPVKTSLLANSAVSPCDSQCLNGFGNDLYCTSQYCYVPAIDGGYMTVIDVSNPHDARFPTGTYTVNLGLTTGSPEGIVVVGDYAYVAIADVAASEAGIIKVKIADPTNVSKIGFYNNNTYHQFGHSVVSDGKYLYVTDVCNNACASAVNGNNQLVIHEIQGIKTHASNIGSLNVDDVQVSGNLNVGDTTNIGNALYVGLGGIASDGPIITNGLKTEKAIVNSTEVAWASATAGPGDTYSAYRTMIEYASILYYGEFGGTNDLYSYDGTTITAAAHPDKADKGQCYPVVVWNGALYSGCQGAVNGDAISYQCDDPTDGSGAGICDDAADWTVAFDSVAHASLTIYKGVMSGIVYRNKLFLGLSGTVGRGDIIVCSSAGSVCQNTEWALSLDNAIATSVDNLIIYQGKLHAFITDSTSTTVWTFIAENSNWTQVSDASCTLTGLKVLSSDNYKGKLYFGTGSDADEGDLYSFNGTICVREQNNTGDDVIYSLKDYQDILYVGAADTGAEQTSAGASWDGATYTDNIINFGGPNYNGVFSWGELNNVLYAGLGWSALGDADIWKYTAAIPTDKFTTEMETLSFNSKDNSDTPQSATRKTQKDGYTFSCTNGTDDCLILPIPTTSGKLSCSVNGTDQADCTWVITSAGVVTETSDLLTGDCNTAKDNAATLNVYDTATKANAAAVENNLGQTEVVVCEFIYD